MSMEAPEFFRAARRIRMLDSGVREGTRRHD